MGVRRSALDLLNHVLSYAGVRLETLTQQIAETSRLQALRKSGHFGRSVFPLPNSIKNTDASVIFEALSRYAARTDDFVDWSRNEVGFSFDNPYFTSPDAEVLYAVLREYQPATIVEIGSGHSTQIMRQAVRDGGFDGRIVAIDPAPRREVSALVDVLHTMPVEALASRGLFPALGRGDLLFIDSSHDIRAGNDAAFIYLTLLPQLPPGVIVHIHDIFLPYEYPEDWVVGRRFGWNEQYIVQAILSCSNRFDVLWPGYFLQATRPDFAGHFPHLRGRTARSLWLRTAAVAAPEKSADTCA